MKICTNQRGARLFRWCIALGAMIGMTLLSLSEVMTATLKLEEKSLGSGPSLKDSSPEFEVGDGGTMARIESSGFFDEPDWRWMLRKLIHIHQAAVDHSCRFACFHPERGCTGSTWFQFHLEPSFQCAFERRVGPRGWRGKWLCDPHRLHELAQTRGCLVYSFQESPDFLFESALYYQVSTLCEIHVFSSRPPQVPAPEFVQHHLRQIGSQAPAIPIHALVKELGHVGRSIDVLHIDCNGCEWEQYQGWFDKDVVVQQFIVRLSWPSNSTSLTSLRPQPPFLQTERYAPPAVDAVKNLFRESGFVVTHKDFDTATCKGNCVDVSFFKLDQTFQDLNLPPGSPFFALKRLQIPSRTCYESHLGLGPLSDPASLGKDLISIFPRLNSNPVGSRRMSLAESSGFIDEADSAWQRRKRIHKEMIAAQRRQIPQNDLRRGIDVFWYYNFYSDFKCDFARRLGQFGDGGKWICDPHRLTLKASSGHGCLVYSIGSNGEGSFETAVHDSISPLCEIHTFDLKPWNFYTNLTMPTFINYHTQRIGRTEWSNESNESNESSIAEIVENLQHSGRTIDIFKIDCEACEWSTYLSWFHPSVDIRMLLVEVHPTFRARRIYKFFQFLRSLGYVIYSKEPNTYGCAGICQEFAFIKLSNFSLT